MYLVLPGIITRVPHVHEYYILGIPSVLHGCEATLVLYLAILHSPGNVACRQLRTYGSIFKIAVVAGTGKMPRRKASSVCALFL